MAGRLISTFNCNVDHIPASFDLKTVKAGTHITRTNRCASRQQRDATVSNGAEAGAKGAMECLDARRRKARAWRARKSPSLPPT